MNRLVWLNRVGAAALAIGFFALLYGHYDYDRELADLKFAVEQSKKGARFTAADGRLVCLALLSAHPEVEDALPEVCKR